MASMFVLALAIPGAFGDVEGGLSEPLLVVGCCFVFRTVHLVLSWFIPAMLLATLLLLATQAEGAAQTALVTGGVVELEVRRVRQEDVAVDAHGG